MTNNPFSLSSLCCQVRVLISPRFLRNAWTGTLIILTLTGCNKESGNEQLIAPGTYKGTFSSTVLNRQDSVFLNISGGYYYCSTNLPFNYGAGLLEISETRVKFIDTLFFPIPAIYITGFALSGEYTYQYNGFNLMLEKNTPGGKTTYRMVKVKE
ncbi:MAG: hypothetical protein AB7E36_09970 [Salinivirgaceae bacterium]